MKKIFLSDKASFELEVPYKLIETGRPSDGKPLIVYLHGFNQNIKQFEELVSPMMDLQAYHLFVQAPYPIYDRRRQKSVEQWGRSWYLYDGDAAQFVRSLESASVFLEGIIKSVQKSIDAPRVILFGYSMGGYLAGYFSLSRVELVNELIVIGARIKAEVFEDDPKSYEHLNVLALHGKSDGRVKSDPQRKSCRQLSEWGATVVFKDIDGDHKLSPQYLEEAKNWINTLF